MVKRVRYRETCRNVFTHIEDSDFLQLGESGDLSLWVYDGACIARGGEVERSWFPRIAGDRWTWIHEAL